MTVSYLLTKLLTHLNFTIKFCAMTADSATSMCLAIKSFLDVLYILNNFFFSYKFSFLLRSSSSKVVKFLMSGKHLWLISFTLVFLSLLRCFFKSQYIFEQTRKHL